jgi:hypothetical protein
MKRYYFDIPDRDGFAPAEVGLELPHFKAAHERQRYMARDAILGPKDNIHPMTVEVRDDDGPVLAVTFVYESKGSA